MRSKRGPELSEIEAHGQVRIRVFVLDDHGVVREGLRQVLSTDPGIEMVGEAATARAGTDGLLETLPDVAIIDVRLPDGSGIDVARHVRSVAPDIGCVMFTAFAGEDAFLKSVMAGALGYISKDAEPSEVLDAVHRAAAGESLIDADLLDELRGRELPAEAFNGLFEALSPHERRILDLVTEGQTNREIADHLHLAEKTIRNYVSTILGKVGVRNRTQLAVYVAQVMARTRG
jgi:two-component system, NarL family, response regulator DevR